MSEVASSPKAGDAAAHPTEEGGSACVTAEEGRIQRRAIRVLHRVHGGPGRHLRDSGEGKPPSRRTIQSPRVTGHYRVRQHHTPYRWSNMYVFILSSSNCPTSDARIEAGRREEDRSISAVVAGEDCHGVTGTGNGEGQGGEEWRERGDGRREERTGRPWP